MPNWCDNSVTITHEDKTKIDAIEASLQTEEQDWFSAVRPRPEADDEDWYGWNVNNWGTKWSPSVHEFNRESDNTIWISFDSAWSPPTTLYEFMSEEYDILAYYHEGGMAFIGKFENGDDDYYEYDISDRESIEALPEDVADYADLMNLHEDWVADNDEEEVD